MGLIPSDFHCIDVVYIYLSNNSLQVSWREVPSNVFKTGPWLNRISNIRKLIFIFSICSSYQVWQLCLLGSTLTNEFFGIILDHVDFLVRHPIFLLLFFILAATTSVVIFLLVLKFFASPPRSTTTPGPMPLDEEKVLVHVIELQQQPQQNMHTD